MSIQRISAIIEREMRKYMRSPVLVLLTIVLPLMQLVILGNSFGGKIQGARIAVVDYDKGPQARRVREALQSVEYDAKTFEAVSYASETRARADLRAGRIHGVVVIPPEFSRRVYSNNQPALGVEVDNTDTFVSSAIGQTLSGLVTTLNQPAVESRLPGQIALQQIELYPYVPYMQYMLPGAITLAMFVSVMIGGGMNYIDDKSRGVHEGYLVTPITRFELVFAMNAAGTMKAAAGGLSLMLFGSLLAGVGTTFQPMHFLSLVVLIVSTSFAFMTMMSCIVSRMDNPLMPRAIFGVLNTLLYFPSGAVYPVEALPWWLRSLTYIDPFTYAVDGFRTLLLRGAGLGAGIQDIACLSVFGAIMLVANTLLFKRTL
ncbi:MAG TPA: ABC transporter permease [Chthoniobacterales bacterium]|jgi:ABC-2 type transport system permease protein|nr:ABC transporter permease [Chthoniobacterales bacterium]